MNTVQVHNLFLVDQDHFLHLNVEENIEEVHDLSLTKNKKKHFFFFL